jgi:hypothetical protein
LWCRLCAIAWVPERLIVHWLKAACVLRLCRSQIWRRRAGGEDSQAAVGWMPLHTLACPMLEEEVRRARARRKPLTPPHCTAVSSSDGRGGYGLGRPAMTEPPSARTLPCAAASRGTTCVCDHAHV